MERNEQLSWKTVEEWRGYEKGLGGVRRDDDESVECRVEGGAGGMRERKGCGRDDGEISDRGEGGGREDWKEGKGRKAEKREGRTGGSLRKAERDEGRQEGRMGEN
jgi:hypothetical protein